MNKILLIFAFSILTISCNKSKEEQQPEPQQKEIIKQEGLAFKVNLITNRTDNFRLLLNKIKSGNSNINIHVTEELKSKEDVQSIEISIKENFFPQEFIIDLGLEKEKTVDIKDIYIKASNFELNIPKNKIDHFFYPNQNTIYDTISQKYKAKTNNKSHLLIFRNRVMDSLWINE